MNKIRIVMVMLQFFCTNSTAIAPSPVRVKPFVLANSNSSFTLDVLTIYNPLSNQCDTSPLVTASNHRINEKKLRSGAIRWMALSRDLLKRWGGRIQYGDTIKLHSGDPSIDGLWVVHDTMNKRFRNRGDLLFDSKVRSRGKWSKVMVTLQKNPVSISLADPTGRP